jgi:hypothetical protein
VRGCCLAGRDSKRELQRPGYSFLAAEEAVDLPLRSLNSLRFAFIEDVNRVPISLPNEASLRTSSNEMV